MATGARQRDISLQIIAEALVVSPVAGQFCMPVSFTRGTVVLAFACAFLTGPVFGFLSARNASRLHPAVALSAACRAGLVCAASGQRAPRHPR